MSGNGTQTAPVPDPSTPPPPPAPPANPPPAPPAGGSFTQDDLDAVGAAARKAATAQRDREIATAAGFKDMAEMTSYLEAKKVADEAALDENTKLQNKAAANEARAVAAETALAAKNTESALTDALFEAGVKPEALAMARQIATPQVLAATEADRPAAMSAAVTSLRSNPATLAWFPPVDANGQPIPAPVPPPPSPGTPPPGGRPAPTPPPPADPLARGMEKAKKLAANAKPPRALKTL